MRKTSRLCTVAVLLMACNSTDRASGGGDGDVGGTIVVAMPEPANALPPFIQSAQDRLTVDLLYDRLADMDSTLLTIGDGGFHSELAERWDWASDSLSIAFHVNPRARFHDGRPVRAKDVKFSFDLMKDPKVAPQVAAVLENVDSVTVRDSLTAVAWFKQRTPEQFYDFAYQIWIMPEHLLGAIPRDQLRTSEINRRPIGSDRFRLARWEPGTRVEFIADTANYRGRAKLDRVVITPVTDYDAGITQFLTGQVDFWESLLPQSIARVDSSANTRVLPYPGLAYAFFSMNERDANAQSRPHPVFADRELRRALTMAIDRQALLRNVYGQYGRPSYGPFPRSLAVADTTLRMIGYDTAAARAKLDSLGWKLGADGVRTKGGRPLAFGTIVPTSSRARMAYAVLLQQQFRSIGAKMDIEQMDINNFVQRKESRKFDAIMDAYNTDPSPSGTRQTWSSAGAHPGGTNAISYRNPQVDALLDSALTSFDAARAKQYMSRAYQIMVDDAPAIWLYDVLTVAGIHKRIRTPGLRADGWWNSLADWYIPSGERTERDRIGLTSAGR
jgi:peptide/nickel transport system substrate-binding protein